MKNLTFLLFVVSYIYSCCTILDLTCCDGNTLHNCAVGSTVAKTNCEATGKICEDGLFPACATETCTGIGAFCDGDISKTCENGEVSSRYDCTKNGQTCENGNCVGSESCSGSQIYCDGDYSITCLNDIVQEKVDCTATGGTCDTTKGTCNGDQECSVAFWTKCDGDNQITCLNGAEITLPCVGGCMNDLCIGLIAGGECDYVQKVWCEGSVLKTCQNQKFLPDLDCSILGKYCDANNPLYCVSEMPTEDDNNRTLSYIDSGTTSPFTGGITLISVTGGILGFLLLSIGILSVIFIVFCYLQTKKSK